MKAKSEKQKPIYRPATPRERREAQREDFSRRVEAEKRSRKR